MIYHVWEMTGAEWGEKFQQGKFPLSAPLLLAAAATGTKGYHVF